MYKDDKLNVLVEWLRCNFTDPRSRLSSYSFTFTGTGAAQTISFSSYLTDTTYSVYCVNSVSGGSTLTKWVDYNIDLQNQNLTGTFTNGTVYTVVVGIGKSCWIYKETPSERLGVESYPRISVKLVGSNANVMGKYDAFFEVVNSYQIDFWAGENYVYTDTDSVKHSGADLANYLKQKLLDYFQTSTNDLYPLMFNFRLLDGRGAVFEPVRELYHSLSTIELTHLLG
ncbi:MAG: hypothetical protein WC307_04955 [Candidatus Nanoarchaeia archaeon]|jgi:hypothetical protein